jgi:hypothetical protein
LDHGERHHDTPKFGSDSFVFEWQRFDCQGADLTGMHGLIVGLHANRSLAKRSVSIGGKDLALEASMVAVTELDLATPGFRSFQHLFLSNNSLRAKGAETLAPALKVIIACSSTQGQSDFFSLGNESTAFA